LLCRVIRYSLLLDQQLIANASEGFVLFLTAIYILANVFGVTAFTFLAFLWIYFFHEIIKSEKRFLNLGLCSKWLLWYIVANAMLVSILILCLFLDLFVLQGSTTLSTAWAGIVLLVTSICVLIYGRKIISYIRSLSVELQQNNRQFNKIHWFTYGAAILNIVAGIFLASATIVQINDKSFGFYLAKAVVYRVIELVFGAIVLQALRPSLREIFGVSFLQKNTDKKVNLPAVTDATTESGETTGVTSSNLNIELESTNSEDLTRE